jgi:hypothetical protein
MAKRKDSEAEIIAALKRANAGPTHEQLGVSPHDVRSLTQDGLERNCKKPKWNGGLGN